MADSPVVSTISVPVLCDRIKQSRAALKRARRWRLVSSGLLVILILGFLFSLYLKVADMYQGRNFEPHARAAAIRLNPVLSDTLRQVLVNVAPEYRKQLEQKLDQVFLAKLAASTEKELLVLCEFIQRNVERDLHAALTRITSTEGERLAQRLGLASQPEREAFAAKWVLDIEKELLEVLARFQDLHTRDLVALQNTIDSFNANNPYSTWAKDDLDREFVHLLLLLADNHVMGR